MSDDDLDDDNLDMDESSFDDFSEGGGSTLGDLWRNNPLVKVGVVAAAAIAIFGTIMLFGNEETPIETSLVASGSDIKAPPGEAEVPEVYRDAVEEENEARTEEAWRTSGSALPTPIDPPVGRLQVPKEDNPDEDPLARWRQLQEQRAQLELQNAQNAPVPEPVVDDTGRSEAIQAMAEAMSQQMQSILESRSTVKIGDSNFTELDYTFNAKKRALEKENELIELECEILELQGGECEEGGLGGGDGDFFEDEYEFVNITVF